MSDFDPIHNELVSAGRDLQNNVSSEIPPFKPRSDMPARIMVVAATLVVFGIGVGGFFRFSGGGEKTTAEFASEEVEQSVDNGQADGGATDNGESGGGTLVVDGATSADNASEGTADEGSADQQSGSDVITESSSEEYVEASGSGPVVVATTDIADLVTDKVYRTRVPLERPTTVKAVRDDKFGVSIQAVTTAKSSEVIGPPANTNPAWNVDGSRLILYHTGAKSVGHVLLDGQTYETESLLPINPRDVQRIYWDPTNKDRFYYVDRESFEFISYNVATDDETTVHTFDCDDIKDASSKRLSDDGNMVAFNCGLDGQRYFVALNIATGVETRVAADTDFAPQVAPTSGLFVVNSSTGGVDVLDSNLKKVRSLPLTDNSDSVVVKTPDGRELFVTSVFGADDGRVGNVVAFDLATGVSQVIVGPESGYPYPLSQTTFAVGVGNSSLVAASIGGTGTASGLLDGELLLVNFESETPTLTRLGHHRASGSSEVFSDYFARPGVAVHADSKRVIFASDWGEDRVDSFVIDIGGSDG